MNHITNNWKQFINKELEKEYFKSLQSFINEEYDKYTCYPKKQDILNALKYTPIDKVKVVIIGQDPYHGPDQAHGLAFSVQDHVKKPPSLKNIYQELDNDLGIKRRTPNLINWAKQGVLLLNTTLTVRKGQPMSHANKGWETFTDNIIKRLNMCNDIIFVLWGGHAKTKKKFIKNKTIQIILASHPSPLSSYRGFFGSKPFSKINELLVNKNQRPIDWR